MAVVVLSCSINLDKGGRGWLVTRETTFLARTDPRPPDQKVKWYEIRLRSSIPSNQPPLIWILFSRYSSLLPLFSTRIIQLTKDLEIQSKWKWKRWLIEMERILELDYRLYRTFTIYRGYYKNNRIWLFTRKRGKYLLFKRIIYA